jgi:hypothetical protein
MLEVEPNDLFTIAKALRSQATGVPVVHTLEDNVRLLEISQGITSRISEEQVEYPGKLYDIWAKGKVRAHLGFKREPDMMVGKAFGKSFLDACIYYCTCVMFTNGAYNPKNNTLGGYILYTTTE